MNGKEERSGRVSLTVCKQLKRGGGRYDRAKNAIAS